MRLGNRGTNVAISTNRLHLFNGIFPVKQKVNKNQDRSYWSKKKKKKKRETS